MNRDRLLILIFVSVSALAFVGTWFVEARSEKENQVRKQYLVELQAKAKKKADTDRNGKISADEALQTLKSIGLDDTTTLKRLPVVNQRHLIVSELMKPNQSQSKGLKHL